MKKVLSVLLATLLMLTALIIPANAVTTDLTGSGATGDEAVSGANIELTETSAKYSSDWRYWSQGASDHNGVKQVGCWIVAMSKMFMESGVAQNGLNPDVFYWWERNNGWVPNNDNNLNQNDGANAPVAYAKAQGKSLSKVCVASNPSKDSLWSYINSGYYTIVCVPVPGGYHYVYIDNNTSKSKNVIYVMDSSSGMVSWGSRSLYDNYSKVLTAYVYSGGSPVSFNASINKGSDSFYLIGESATISLDATTMTSAILKIYHTPIGGETYLYWEGQVNSNQYATYFDLTGYYSCEFLVNVGDFQYESNWVGWSVIDTPTACVDRGSDGFYLTGESASISLVATNPASSVLRIYHTPFGGNTYLYWEGQVNSDQYTTTFYESGYYSCYFSINYTNYIIDSEWVGWHVVDTPKAISSKGEEAVINIGEDIVLSPNATGFDNYTLKIIHTPTGGETYLYWQNEVSQEGYTVSFPYEGYYACCFILTKNGHSIESEWVGWLVKEPIAPSVTVQTNHNVLEVTWNDVGAESYYLYVWNKETEEIPFGNNLGKLLTYELSVSEGSWRVFVTAVYNNETMLTGYQDIEIVNSDPIIHSILGDADGDGQVTILDATIIQRYLVSYTVKNPERVVKCGDISDDGLDIIDATLIQRYLASYSVNYPIGEEIKA